MAAWTVRPRAKTLDQYWAKYAAACSNGCLSLLHCLDADDDEVLPEDVEVVEEEVEGEELLEDRDVVEEEEVEEAEVSESSPPVRWP